MTESCGIIVHTERADLPCKKNKKKNKNPTEPGSKGSNCIEFPLLNPF